jgi:hypothetical protein
MPKVFKSQLIELINPANSGATKIQFQDQPYLRNKQIFGIEILTVNDMTKSPTNRNVITTANMQISYLTLYLNDVQNSNNVGEWIQSVPFPVMHRIQNSQTEPFVRQMFELQGQVIYWEKCYISCATSLGNTSDVSFLIQVYFK